MSMIVDFINKDTNEEKDAKENKLIFVSCKVNKNKLLILIQTKFHYIHKSYILQ
jgi:hypothetical protein